MPKRIVLNGEGAKTVVEVRKPDKHTGLAGVSIVKGGSVTTMFISLENLRKLSFELGVACTEFEPERPAGSVWEDGKI